MAVRNLYRQARPFRFLGWALFMLMLLAAPAGQIGQLQLVCGSILAIVGMFILDLLRVAHRFGVTPSLTDTHVRWLQHLELGIVPCLLLILQMPLAIVLAVLGALINANVALGGTRALIQALLLVGLSVTVGWSASPQAIPLTVDPGLWIAAVVLLVVFSVALADIGFALTQKLDNHRLQWQERVTLLRPFIPQGLSYGTPIQERRFITVVMVDLVEFTQKSASLAPEVVGTVLDDLLDAVVSQANQTGGTLDKFMGDGALLFFSGDPSAATSSDAVRRQTAMRGALRFATSLGLELDRLNARWQGVGVEGPLQLRVGIASGYCSLGQLGRNEVRAYTMIGACVGLAERLQCICEPNSLALCPVSARLLHDSQFNHKELMPPAFELMLDGARVSFVSCSRELKGFAQMRVYRPSDKVHAPTI